MLNQIKNRKEQGFTIIEVLIVLAIAGLIMLVVFLAVPALNRNSRNTGRKSDVSRVATAISEWQSNNNGAVLTAGAGNANLTAVIDAAGPLNQYTLVAAAAVGANSLTIATGTQAAMAAGAGNANLGSMQIVTGATCGASGATLTNTSTRRTVIQSLVETSNGITAVCREV